MRDRFEDMAIATQTKPKLITITLPSKYAVSNGFDISLLNPIVDFYCLLTYNYHTPYEYSANHHSPLRKAKQTPLCNKRAEFNAHATVEMYKNKTVELGKLILGIPLFGLCLALENKSNRIGAPILGTYKDEHCPGGALSYSEICMATKNNIWKTMRPDCNVGPYGYGNTSSGNHNFWIGYDDEISVKDKGFYAKNNSLGGLGFWELAHDDYKNVCGNGRYPMLNAAIRGLESSNFTCKETDSEPPSLKSSGSENTKKPFTEPSTKEHDNTKESSSYNPFKMASSNTFTGIWGVVNFCVGVIGNVFTLVAIPYAAKRRRHNLDKNWYTSTIFILNLAIFDLGFCIFGMPQNISYYLGIEWSLGTYGCKLFNNLGPLFAYGDWYALGLIAITKAFSIVKMSKWSDFCDERRNVFLLIIGTWVFNISIFLPRLFSTNKEFVYDEYSGTCQYVSTGTMEVSSGWIFIKRMPHYMAFILTTLAILISYFTIWRFVKQTRENVMNDLSPKKRLSKTDLRLAVTLGILCVFFIICVFPLTLLKLFASKDAENTIISLYWAQYSINIFVYSARRDQFWRAYQDILKICWLPFKTILPSTKTSTQEGYMTASLTIQEPQSTLNPTKRTEAPAISAGNANSVNLDNENLTAYYQKEPKSNKRKYKLKRKRNDPIFRTDQSMATFSRFKRKERENQKEPCVDPKKVKITIALIISILLVVLFGLEFMAKSNYSILLILGGYTTSFDVCSGFLNHVQLLDLEKSSDCVSNLGQFSAHLNDEASSEADDLPKSLRDASGGLLHNAVPIVCGGVNEDWETSRLCYKMISAKNWKKIANMSIERSTFYSTVTKWGFLVVGGYDRSYLPTDTIELLPSIDSKFTPLKPFPERISSGCMATLENGTVVLTGGYYYGPKLINSVWRNVDIKHGTWEKRANMSVSRAKHSCVVMRDSKDGREKLVVTGGTVSGSHGSNSTEILDVKDGVWSDGPILPMNVSLAQLIPDGRGGCLLVGGREVVNSNTKRLTSILHLSSDLKEWKVLGRNLKIGSDSHVAMLVPNQLINCST